MALTSLGTLGDYRLVQLLGQGGMGEVYLACREGPEGFLKEVVIKCMHKHLAEDQGFVDLFLNEARLAILLQHPNIVQTLELNRDQKSWFIVMEHVRGCSLKACIRRAKKNYRQIPETIAVWLIAEALQGLHFTHNLSDSRGRPLGILHRDVSPDNLLLSWDGAVKLVDFGVSKATFQNGHLPTGGPKGKFPYMAPEYFNGNSALDARSIGVRSDIYSMGVSLHELLTLELPNCVPADRKSMAAPRTLYQPQKNLSQQLNDILFRALNPNPAERWGSAAEMAGALIQSLVARRQSVHASTVSVWMRDFWDLCPDETFVGLEASYEEPSIPSASGVFFGTDVLEKPEELAQQALALQSPPPQNIPNPNIPKRNLLQGVTAAVCLLGLGLWAWAVLFSPGAPPPAPAEQAPLPPVAAPPPPWGLSFAELYRRPLAGVVMPEDKTQGDTPWPASERMGFVRIRAAPNTIVSHQGKRLGKTPMKAVALPAGQVRLHVRNKQLGISKSYQVHIEPGKEAVLRIRNPKAKAPSP